jgi:hypothetical protein
VSWPEELQPYARSSLREAESMLEVLQHAFEGRAPSAALPDRVQMQ